MTIGTNVILSDETKAKIEAATNQRTKVAALIECGEYTKVQMADTLGISVPSIGTQMTYLRIAGMFMTYNDDRVYNFCSEEDFKHWDSSRKANTKAKAEPKTVEEQYNTLVKSLKRLNTQFENTSAKLPNLKAIAEDDQASSEDVENFNEAEAKSTILVVAIRRAERRLKILTDSTTFDCATEDDVDVDVDVDESDDLL